MAEIRRREFHGRDSFTHDEFWAWTGWFRDLGIRPQDVATTGFVEVKGNTVSYESYVKQGDHFVRTADGLDIAKTVRTVELDYTPRPFPEAANG